MEVWPWRLTRYLHTKGISMNHTRKTVQRFIRDCICCQKLSTTKVLIRIHPITLSTLHTNDRWSIDFMGPYKVSRDGFQYLLVIIDCFDRFLELIPTKSDDIVSTAKGLLSVMERLRRPQQLTSDRGKEYILVVLVTIQYRTHLQRKFFKYRVCSRV